MAEQPTPVKVRLHMVAEMSDGTLQELEVPEIDMTRLGSGLTSRLLDDLRTEGIVTQHKPVGPKVPGIVFAIRGALIEQADGALYVQREHQPEPGQRLRLTDVAESEAPRGR